MKRRILLNSTPRTGLQIHCSQLKTQFVCDKCGDKFTKSWILKHHIANAHPLKCNVCDRKFTQKLILDHHMALCKSENTFECDVCDSKFTQKGDLEEHIANVHEGKKSAKYPKIKLKGTGNLESHTTELKFGVHEEKKPTERDLEDHNVHEEKKSMSPKIEFEVICDYVHNLTMMMLMTKKKHRMKNLIHL